MKSSACKARSLSFRHLLHGDGKVITPGNPIGQLFLRRRTLVMSLFIVAARKAAKATVNALRPILIALVYAIVVGIAIETSQHIVSF